MLPQTRHKASIHPSIEGLVSLIESNKDSSFEESASLRDMCQRKIRSYREDLYLKRYTTAPEQDAARNRWQVVSEFANRHSQRPR